MSRNNDLQFSRIELDLPAADTVIPGLAVFSNTAHNGLHARHQFLMVERLANVIIRANPEALQFRLDGILRGHKNKWNVKSAFA